jgi:phosphate/sulfate permease
MTIFLILSVVLLSFANGANDNFKGVATLWGSGLTTYQRAIAWGTGFTFLGSLGAIWLHAASTGVVVDAKDASALAFYRKYGFIDLPQVERRLFLPMGSIEQLFR